MLNENDILLDLYNTSSSTMFKRSMSDPKTKNVLLKLVGDSVPVNELGLNQKTISKLSRIGIKTVYQLLLDFPNNISTGGIRNTSDFSLIATQLEIYMRDLIEITLDSVVNDSPKTDNASQIDNYEIPPFESFTNDEIAYSHSNKTENVQNNNLCSITSIQHQPNDFNSLCPSDTIIKLDNFPKAIHYLQKKDIPIEEIELSVRTFNALKRANINFISQILQLKKKQIDNIRNLGGKSLNELVDRVTKILRDMGLDYNELNDTIISEEKKEAPDHIEHEYSKEQLEKYSGVDLFEIPSLRQPIINWFEKCKMMIVNSSLSNRYKNALLRYNIISVAQLLEMNEEDIAKIKKIGTNSCKEISDFKKKTLEENRSKFVQYLLNDSVNEEYDQETVKQLILNMYNNPDQFFYGFSFKEFRDTLPEAISDEKIKDAVSSLLRSEDLEYVDFRCYKVYTSFEDYFSKKAEHDVHMQLLKERFNDKTIQALSVEKKVSKQRISQIIEKAIKSINRERNNTVFDDDYYFYLYTNYSISDDVWINYLCCSKSALTYLKFFAIKGKDTILENALDDPKVTVNLKYRLQKYLDSKKIFIDDIPLEANRNAIEEYILKTYCSDEKTFDEFVNIYNNSLQKANVNIDSHLYINKENEKTRQNTFATKKNVLWKNGSRIRYYDINNYDFEELLDTIEIFHYFNTEISTYKWYNDYPDIMTKYDIRDHYELHCLLKKIIDVDTYTNDIQFKKQPTIRFGKFNRDDALLEIITALSPVDTDTLVEYIKEKFGYSRETILASYLTKFNTLYHNGIYSVDFKTIPEDIKTKYVNSLADDYYSIEDLKKIYSQMFSDQDPEAINPQTLKQLGFLVYNGYVIRNYKSTEEYFRYILTKDDITDIQKLRKFYSAAYNTFTSVIKKLCTESEILYFDNNHTINFRRLEKIGITKQMLKDYCNCVETFIDINEYFTIKRLRDLGFEHQLDSTGLEDFFYGSILANDNRFSWTKINGEIILCKNVDNTRILQSDYIYSIIIEHIAISVDEVERISKNKYGIVINEKYDIIKAAQNNGMYYDNIMEKIYIDKRYYYEELERIEMEE